MWRPWREVMALAAASLALAGCAGVPISGPIVKQTSVSQQESTGVNVVAVPPAQGATALLVVEGFLHAMGNDQPGFPVARQYLTASASRLWRPDAGVSIYADGFQPKETEASTPDHPAITLDAGLTGTLSPSGEYREASGGLPRTDFGLVRDPDGEWRISKPPEGLLISRYHFTNNYAAHDLHFLDPTGTALVPDPRYFAQNAVNLSMLVRAQLAGPGAWLAPAVRRQPTAALTLERVDFSGQGTVDVQLRGSVNDLDDFARRALMAEITATVTDQRQATGVHLLVGANQLVAPGTGSTTLTPQDFAALAPAVENTARRLFVVHDHQIQLLDGNSLAPGGFARALNNPGALAVRADLGQVATVNPERTTLSVAAPEADTAKVTATGKDLLRPDYSRTGELWAIGNGAGAAGFQVLRGQDLRPLPVTISEMPAERVRAFRVSPDGARIALILDGGKVEQVGMARIVRTADAIRLEAFRPVNVSPPAGADRRLLDVGWLTPTDLLVLVSQSSYSNVVRVDQDSAAATDIGPGEVSGLTELAVAPGVAVLRSPVSVLRYDGPFDWKPLGIVLTAVAYSG